MNNLTGRRSRRQYHMRHCPGPLSDRWWWAAGVGALLERWWGGKLETVPKDDGSFFIYFLFLNQQKLSLSPKHLLLSRSRLSWARSFRCQVANSSPKDNY